MLLRATVFVLVVLCVVGSHVSSSDDNEELARNLKGLTKRHYVTKFVEKVTMKDILETLPHATHVKPIPGGGHCIYTSLNELSKLPWKVASAKEMKPHHKCHHALDLSEDATTSSFVLTLTEDITDNTLRQILSERDISLKNIRRGKYLKEASSTKIEVALNDPKQYNTAVKALSTLDEVRWIEKSRPFYTQNAIASWTTQGEVVDQHPLWDAGLDGTGEVVHIGDTGLDYDSCFFHDPDQEVKFYPETNPQHRKVLSYVECQDFEVKDHVDLKGAHGTHVAGTFCGKSITKHQDHNGGVPEAKLVFGDLKCGVTPMFLPPDLFELYEPGRLLGAAISSNSWGSNSAPIIYQGTETETDAFTWDHPYFLPVFAAGNSKNGGILSPATSKNSITVGAHANSANNIMRDQVASFSARGPTYDMRPKPDIMAPGKSLSSAASDGKQNSYQCTLESKEGTSMATPVVAAAATMVRQYFKNGYYPSGSRNPSHSFEPRSTLIKAMLIHSGEHMSSVPSEHLPNNDEGFGRMKIYNLLPDNKHKRVHVVNEDYVKQDETVVLCYTLSKASTGANTGTKNFRATLTYLDPPAAEGSLRALVNDIDLTVQTPSGELLRSNMSRYHTGNNNVERIDAPKFEVGQYRVFITGYDVTETFPYIGVPYSLVVSGASLKRELKTEKCNHLGCPKIDGKVCSGNGDCQSGTATCKCSDSHHHVACDLCSNQKLCNDRGTCNENDLTCKCVDTAVGDNCESCAEGWFGPKCEGDCKCVRGTCNTEAGECICDKNWQGSHCDRCDTNLRGEDCTDESHWCVNRQVVEITDDEGFIEISSGPKYDNGMNCMWLIKPPSEDNEVTLTFNWIQIENRFDYIHVFAGDSAAAPKLYSFTQGSISSPETVTNKGTTLIRFMSDSIENERGFELKYSIKRSCPSDGKAYCNDHGRCVSGGVCECFGVWDPETLCKTKRVVKTPSPTVRTPSPTPHPTTVQGCPEDGAAYCNNRGQCIDNGKCRCEPNYDPSTLCKTMLGETPEPVQTPEPHVSPSPTQPYVECTDPSHCKCKAGTNYRGKHCQLEFANWWSPFVCNGHGEQYSHDDSCACDAFWKGTNCQWCSNYNCITSELTFSVPYRQTLSQEVTFFKILPISIRGAGIQIKVCLSSPKWSPHTIALWVGDYYPLEPDWNATQIHSDLCLSITGWNEENTVYILGLRSESGSGSDQLLRADVVSEIIMPELYGISVEIQDPEVLGHSGFGTVEEGLVTFAPAPAPIERRGVMFLAIGLLIGVIIAVVPIIFWWRKNKAKLALEKEFESKGREEEKMGSR
eukprot:TRINITY_DN7186_c1_g1_i3.p1 TRINITY_DN7186_c1_g1~~TRINITY_DN7186_c1_g1_i3.p1  ORF type:complete len:1309 (+),score=278.31 TRINITY_DN7186_c1_g1_i3:63-3989(+)